MESRPYVILGKPMRKFKPSFVAEDETEQTKEVKKELTDQASITSSPTKKTKTLLEESLVSRQTETSLVHEETIGVDKRLLMSVLSAQKSHASIDYHWRPFSAIKSIKDEDMDKLREKLKIIV